MQQPSVIPAARHRAASTIARLDFRLLRPSGVRDVKVSQLLATPMFATLTARQVRWLASVADQMSFPAGTRIDTIGSYLAWVYVVLDGRVECVPEERANGARRRHLLLAVSEARVLILDRRCVEAVDRMVPGFASRVSIHSTVGAELPHSIEPYDPRRDGPSGRAC